MLKYHNDPHDSNTSCILESYIPKNFSPVCNEKLLKICKVTNKHWLCFLEFTTILIVIPFFVTNKCNPLTVYFNIEQTSFSNIKTIQKFKIPKL